MTRTASMVLFLITFLAASATAQGISLGLSGRPGGADPSAVKSRILASTTAIAAGRPFTLAVQLTTSPNWHIYWSNPGEAGLPTTFKWQLPPGFTAEPLPFPLPAKHVQPGDITVYGYEGSVTFLFKIIPPDPLPADAVQDGRMPFSVAASWLCCNKDQCVPGDAKLSLSLPIATPMPANDALFAAARQALPLAASQDKNAEPQKGTFELKAEHSGAWTLPISFKEAPASVEAFPENVDGLLVSGIKIELSKQNATISLTARILTGQTLSSTRLPLLLVYTSTDGRRHGFPVDLDLKPLSSPP